MSNPNPYPQYPSQPSDDYSTPLFGKPMKAPKKDKTARTFTDLLLKGMWVNSIVSAIATVVLTIPLLAMAAFGTLAFGVFGFLFLLLFLVAAVSLIAIGFFWSAANAMLMWLLMMTIKNKVASSLIAPLFIGVLVFVTRFYQVGFDNPFIYIAYGFIGANIVTSIVLNLRSQVPVPDNIFKSVNFKSKSANNLNSTVVLNSTTPENTDLPPSFTEHKSDD
jgi:hypothetical protein